MIENVANAAPQQPSPKQHMTLEEFCGTIRRMESQGQDGVSLFNDVISQGYAPDLMAEDEFQHSRRLERITTGGDLKVIGNMMPRYEYSFHVGGNFKGFDLDVFFQGVGKRDMWTQSAFVFPMMRSADLAIFANQTKYNIYDPENGVVNISEDNDFPCLFPGNEFAGNVVGLSGEGGCHNYYPQTKYLVDMSYLRLKNITLGYTLPENWTRKAFIDKLRVYGSVNNLCLLHKGSGDLPIDPEMNAGQGALGSCRRLCGSTWYRQYP